MRLVLDPKLGEGYPSKSQWARRVTEGWAADNLYCVNCSSDRLSVHPANRAVDDFCCPKCKRNVQVKAKNGVIGKTVSNSAYERKATAIKLGRAPDYCFMAYDRDSLAVSDVLWVPSHFMTLSVISKRPPLRASAERAGWVGSNIHLDRIPTSGKVPIVEDGAVRAPKEVRHQINSLAFMRGLNAEKRGWLADVLACLDQLHIRRGSQFDTADVYALEDHLQTLHPKNNNVRPKIRQQLQELVRHRVIRRVEQGRYARL